MTKSQFLLLVSKLRSHIEKIYYIREPISPEEQLAATLRYLASGDSLTSIAYAYRLGKSTVCNIVRVVCKALWKVLLEEVFPNYTEERWLEIERQFFLKWNMPHCIGSVDGKHIQVQAPPNSGSTFYNYKGFFSIVLMAICDADYKFIYVDVGAQGRHSDGGVFRKSSFYEKLKKNTLNIPQPNVLKNTNLVLSYYIVGDEAFPLLTNLMRPYPGQYLEVKKRLFNYRLSRARRTIENSFGILANRWRIFRKPIIASVESIEYIVLACVALHHWLIISGQTENQTYVGTAMNLTDPEVAFRNIRGARGNMYNHEASTIRDDLSEYFMGPGQVPFQWEML